MAEENKPSLSLQCKLRLKELLDAQQKLDEDLPNYDTEAALQKVEPIIHKADQIINDYEKRYDQEPEIRTTVVVMDANVLKVNHELVSKVFKRYEEFNEKCYAIAIGRFVSQAAVPNWHAFAEIVCKTARTINLQSTMLGAAEAELKMTFAKQRQKRRCKVLSEEKYTETVLKLKRQDEGAKKINMALRQLVAIFSQNNCDTMPFYKLIVDPKNFMNSVENAFQLAFLARDSVIGLDVGEDGHPTVCLVKSAVKKN